MGWHPIEVEGLGNNEWLQRIFKKMKEGSGFGKVTKKNEREREQEGNKKYIKKYLTKNSRKLRLGDEKTLKKGKEEKEREKENIWWF